MKKALILAAGLGRRMRPLTDATPKPLLPVGGKPLIAWHLEKLAVLGIDEAIINTSWLAAQFPATLGDGANWGIRLRYINEGPTPLETGGGMLHALPLLGDRPFLLVNGDIWTDYDFTRLPTAPTTLAHLVMVDVPTHAQTGDFALAPNGRLRTAGAPLLTYTGLGVYRPEILQGWESTVAQAIGNPPRFPLAPLLRAKIQTGQISGEHYHGRWTDVGTPQRLAELEANL